MVSRVVSAKVVYTSGKQRAIEVNPISAIEIKGTWKVSFAPKMDQPFEMDFPGLIDFSKLSSKSVNYFSGTATYRKNIIVDSASIKDNQRVILDLGVMNDIADVKINGKELGVLWYPPYTVDISKVFKPGKNELEIAVTNNWANRLIGDEQEPVDFEWGIDRGEKMGRAMLVYPDWFIKNMPRSSQGRKTFSIWYYYRTESLLKPTGLVGPIKLVFLSEVGL